MNLFLLWFHITAYEPLESDSENNDIELEDESCESEIVDLTSEPLESHTENNETQSEGEAGEC